MISRIKIAACLTCLSLMMGVAVHAEEAYPSRPLRIINPNPAGAGVDILVRAFAERLAGELKQSVVVENRTGAGGTIGVEAGVRSPADGYTITVLSNALYTVTPLVYPKLSYKPAEDFEPISILSSTAYVLVANPKLAVADVSGLIKLAAGSPGKLTYASTGNGTNTHIAAEYFKRKAQVDITHIPYRGGSQAVTDLVGGRVDILFSNIPNAVAGIRSGQMRALGVTGTARSASLPDVPTFSERALPGYSSVGWHAIAVPKGTPADIVKRLYDATVKVSHHPDYVAYLKDKGFEVVASSPQEMRQAIKSESGEMGTLVKDLNIKLD